MLLSGYFLTMGIEVVFEKDTRIEEIRAVPENGQFILPLSMSKLHNGQSPQKIIEFLNGFIPRLRGRSYDVVLIYTDGLYSNTEQIASAVRPKTINRVRNHVAGMRSLISDQPGYISHAFHFLPWNTVLTQTGSEFEKIAKKIRILYASDPDFRNLIQVDLKGRENTAANRAFILEEIAFSHAIREGYTKLPHYLSDIKSWRMFCYPGKPIRSEIYAIKRASLPKNPRLPLDGALNRGIYDISQDCFHTYVT